MNDNNVPVTDIKEEFTGIYDRNYWNSAETVSGGGSELKFTVAVRKLIPTILKKYNVKSILDVGCGDLNWMSKVDLSSVKYTGCDVVDALIEANKVKYPKYKFIVADITKDKLDKVDLIICRNVLFHLSFDSVKLALDNMRAISRWMLITTHVNTTDNVNIQNGDFRPLNLMIDPINLPEPEKIYLDAKEFGANMGLWRNT